MTWTFAVGYVLVALIFTIIGLIIRDKTPILLGVAKGMWGCFALAAFFGVAVFICDALFLK